MIADILKVVAERPLTTDEARELCAVLERASSMASSALDTVAHLRGAIKALCWCIDADISSRVNLCTLELHTLHQDAYRLRRELHGDLLGEAIKDLFQDE